MSMSVTTTLRGNNTLSSPTSPAFEASAAAAASSSSLQANGLLKSAMTGIGSSEHTGTSLSSSSSSSSSTMTSSTATKTQQPPSSSCATSDGGGGGSSMYEHNVLNDAVNKTPTVYGKHNAIVNLIDDAATHIATSNAALILSDLNYGAGGDLHSKTSPSASQQKVDQLQQQLQQHHQQQTRLNDDARTLQLALELSLVGLHGEQNCYFEHQQKQQQQQQQQQHPHTYSLNSQQQQQQHQHTNNQLQKTEFDVDTLSAISAVIAANHTSHSNLFSSNSASSVSGLLIPSNVLEDRSKKSQNMTECVPVPSSEHVAEIVGRQGCKIKALRAKTNTYIKTPVRGEEPVFVVTGRKEDVNKAKREILSAADHFSLIRATRKPASVEGNSHNVNLNSGVSAGGVAFVNGNGSGNGVNSRGATSGPPSLPGQVTIQVRVPYRVVGLVVGPKGATIKHIQQETQTYIVTPSREKEPIFEVTGLPESVQTARKQIEAHIALRTGNPTQNNNNNSNSGSNNNNNSNALANLAKVSEQLSDLPNVHTINTLSQILNDDINSEFLASLYENGICSGLEYCDDALGIGGHVGGSAAVAAAAGMAPPLTPPPLPPPSFNMITTTVTAGGGGYSNGIACNNRFQMQQQQQQQHHQLQGGIQDISTLISECNLGSSAQHVKARHEAQAIKQQQHGHNASTNNGLTRSCSSASSTTSTNGTNNSSAAGSSSTNSNSPPELLNIWKNLSESLDVDEGIGDSPNIWNLPSTLTCTALTGSHCSPNTSISPTDSLLGELNAAAAASQQLQQLQQRQTVSSDMSKGAQLNSSGGGGGIILQQEHQLLAGCDRNLPPLRRDCFVCNEREVTTALVPCGHNMFCMDCANQICVAMDAICPVCNSIVYHAMRIIA